MEVKEMESNEVQVIQYLRPDGRKREMLVEVGEDYVEKAQDMFLSAEELTTGEIAVYARFNDETDEDERLELAINGPGDKNPTAMLQKVIDKKYTERND